MANLFFRTNIAPYRVDIYNMLHDEMGFELYFYRDFDTSQKLDMKSILKRCSFEPHYLKGVDFSPSRKICTGIRTILSKNKPDIVIVPEFQILTFQVILLRLFFKKKFKIISMCDDSYDMVANKHEFTAVHRFARKISLPFLDDVITLDNRVTDWYRKNFGKGIWLPIIRDEQSEQTEQNKALDLSNELNTKFDLLGKKVLLFVGRLVKLKNLERLLDAVQLCEEDFVTVIVGSGEEEETLKARAKGINKRVVFIGQQQGSHLRAWYNIADAFILPSYLEPFGAVTNEALAAGDYALVSKNAGSSTLITKENGMTFDPYNVEEMKSSIDKMMQKVSSEKSEIVLKEHKMPFTFEQVVKQFKKAISKG